MPVEPERCLTCSDEAVAARVVEVEGRREQVGIELVAPVERGERLLCHAGIALTKVEEDR